MAFQKSRENVANFYRDFRVFPSGGTHDNFTVHQLALQPVVGHIEQVFDCSGASGFHGVHYISRPHSDEGLVQSGGRYRRVDGLLPEI
jgi:hypothetical protein